MYSRPVCTPSCAPMSPSPGESVLPLPRQFPLLAHKAVQPALSLAPLVPDLCSSALALASIVCAGARRRLRADCAQRSAMQPSTLVSEDVAFIASPRAPASEDRSNQLARKSCSRRRTDQGAPDAASATTRSRRPSPRKRSRTRSRGQGGSVVVADSTHVVHSLGQRPRHLAGARLSARLEKKGVDRTYASCRRRRYRTGPYLPVRHRCSLCAV